MTESIRLFPDPVLRQIAVPVLSFDGNLKKIVKELDKIMRSQPSGIGIAAPQIGISKQIAIVDVSTRVSTSKRIVLINPEILDLRIPRYSREGCMSLPDYTANLKRFDWCQVAFQDEDGVHHELTCEGIEAICVQHEIDHLKGNLFLDHVVSLKTDMIPRYRRFDHLRAPQ